MAHQSTGDVETPLEQSVVHKTTDVDASTPNSSLLSGENQEISQKINNTQTKSDSSSDDTLAVVNNLNGNGDKVGKADEVTSKTSNKASKADFLSDSKPTDGVDGSGSSSTDLPNKANNDTSKGSSAEGSSKVVRPSVVKKPTSFKAVSINKHFLEKASSTGPASASSRATFVPEKPSPMMQQSSFQGLLITSSAKPRLVARTAGFGLRDSSPGAGGMRQSVGNGQKKGPEAQRTVWTKNQPPPVAPQKELSDEELKNTYGIHLASRLQSDEGGKETKWADADDDEDWMPEAVEWSDGTKIQVAAVQPSEQATTVEAPAIGLDIKLSSAERSPELTAAFVATADEKSSSDTKPIEPLVAQATPAPPPRISPWASISTPSQPSPFNNDLNQTSDSNHTSHHQFTKQVPSDDFNRSWRDRTSSSRELFNSETGQLEPVNDRRNRNGRFSRTDWQSKQPTVQTVLQRPASQLSSPAEPSPAFQQHRYRSDEYSRRRASSNVSGGSTSTGRRLSFTRAISHTQDQPVAPEEAHNSYRPNPYLPPENVLANQPVALEEVHTSYRPNPYLPPENVLANQPPLSTSFGEPEIVPEPPTPPPTVPIEEDPLVIQQRIMKETIEAARRRKIEEAEAEKAEKEKRVKARLEMLEKSEAEKQAAIAAAAAAAAVTVVAPKSETEIRPAISKPASPQPANKSDYQQPIKQDNISLSSFSPSNHTQPNAVATSDAHSPAKVDSIPVIHHGPYRSPVKQYLHPADPETRGESWKPAPATNERYTNWGHTVPPSVNNHSQPGVARGNPWGPVGDKSRHPVLEGVGNRPYDPPQYSQYGRGPVSYQPPPSGPQYAPPVEYQVPSPARPGFGRMPSPVRRPPHLSQNFQRDRLPPLSTSPIQEQQRIHAISQWQALPERIQLEEDEEKEKLFRQQQKAIEEAEARAAKIPIAPPRITEKWRKVEQTQVPDSTVVAVQPESHDAQEQSPIETIITQQPLKPLPPHLRQQAPKLSRFFPESYPDESSQVSDEIFETRLQLTASPPPGGKPVVHLPQIPPHRRKSSTEVTSPILQNGQHRHDNDTSRIEAVQMKIKALVHHSPESKIQDALASTTKPFLEETQAEDGGSTNVTLPSKPDGPQAELEIAIGLTAEDDISEDPQPWTKPSEEGLFAELYVQHFGSKPTVCVPINVHSDAMDKPIPQSQSSKLNRKSDRIQVESIPLILHELFPSDRFITIRLPASMQTKDVPFAHSSSNSRPKNNKWSRGKQNRMNSSRDYSYGEMRGGMHGLSGRAIADPVQ